MHTHSQVGETHHSFVHKTVNSDSDLFLNCAAGYLENLFFHLKYMFCMKVSEYEKLYMLKYMCNYNWQVIILVYVTWS